MRPDEVETQRDNTMFKAASIGDSEEQVELIDRLIAATTNPRDRAFIALLARSGIRISEAVQLKVSDVDFHGGTLKILHLKDRLKLKCPHCGESLGKRHLFCPDCGNKVGRAIREKVEQSSQDSSESFHREYPVDTRGQQILLYTPLAI